MSTLKDYLKESEFWADRPRQGDDLDIELAPDELVEGRVIESDGSMITLEVSESAYQALESRGMLRERIARYGAVGSNRAMGFSLEEDDIASVPEDQSFQRMLELAGIREAEANTTDPLADKAAALAPVSAQGDQDPVDTIDEGSMSEVDIDLQSLANRGDEEDLIAALQGEMGSSVADVLNDMMIDLQDELASRGMTDVMNDDDKMIEMLWDKIVDEFGGQDLDEDGVDPVNAQGMDAEELSGNMTAEAEYQGREVPLNKPMRGDVKKSKVYVKDPSTGNVKKVNFGDPNMKIKKSNPDRRRSFRARHNCDNPGPKTKARYWSCRAW
jgi:hypothetical protein